MNSRTNLVTETGSPSPYAGSDDTVGEAAQHAAREARAQELHEAQLAFLRRKHSPDACDSMDLVEAQALGIDTADWPQSDMGALDGR